MSLFFAFITHVVRFAMMRSRLYPFMLFLPAGYNAPGMACLLSVKEIRRFLHPRAFLPQNNRNTAFYAFGLGLVFCMRLFVRQYVQPVAHRNAAFGFCRGASHLLESHLAAPAFLMLSRHASSLALFARSISMCTRILFLMLIALAPFLSPTLGVGIRGRRASPVVSVKPCHTQSTAGCVRKSVQVQ